MNPAKLLNQFSDPEEQREVASLFSRFPPSGRAGGSQTGGAGNRMPSEKRQYRLAERTPAPTDLAGLQKIIEARKRLEDLERGRVTLHISFD